LTRDLGAQKYGKKNYPTELFPPHQFPTKISTIFQTPVQTVDTALALQNQPLTHPRQSSRKPSFPPRNPTNPQAICARLCEPWKLRYV